MGLDLSVKHAENDLIILRADSFPAFYLLAGVRVRARFLYTLETNAAAVCAPHRGSVGAGPSERSSCLPSINALSSRHLMVDLRESCFNELAIDDWRLILRIPTRGCDFFSSRHLRRST